MAKRSKFDILDRFSEITLKKLDPKLTDKEMRILELREKNLLEMMEEGMEEFSEGGAVVPKKVKKMKKGGLVENYEYGGEVKKKKGKGKKSGSSCRGVGAAVKGTRFSGIR